MILLTGASASGKTEIAKLLRLRYGIAKAVTHTSREPRPGEINAVDYFFVKKDDFERLKSKNSFVETTLYNGNYYGCSKGQVSDDKCVVVDPNGLRSFLALNECSIVTFYLEAKEETRVERMKGRGDKPSEIERRIVNDRVDFRDDNIAPTDFRIQTDGRSLDDIAQEIYSKYIYTLKQRGLTPIIGGKKID
jgi:guanylate kinase